MRNVVWTISNLFRGKPQPHLSAIVAAVPTLVAVLQHGDEEVLTDCCWCLSYLTDGANERIQVCDVTTVLVSQTKHTHHVHWLSRTGGRV